MSARRAGSVLVMPARCSQELPYAVKQVLGEVAIEFARHVGAGRFRTAERIEEALDGGEAPILAVWPVLPRLRPEHGLAALDDLASGCDLVLGPLTDGGLYLLGLARAIPALLAFPESIWQTEDAMPIAFRAAQDQNLSVGILRAERGLTTAADGRAALADPLLPERVARAVREVPG